MLTPGGEDGARTRAAGACLESDTPPSGPGGLLVSAAWFLPKTGLEKKDGREMVGSAPRILFRVSLPPIEEERRARAWSKTLDSAHFWPDSSETTSSFGPVCHGDGS